MSNLGGSVGISILVATLAENTQVVHSRLVEGLRPDNPLAQAPYLAAPFSLSTPSGIAALNTEVTRQAAMAAAARERAGTRRYTMTRREEPPPRPARVRM